MPPPLKKVSHLATAKLKGVPLKTHITGLMGTGMTTEATAVSTAPIPEST